jgi:acetyl/propionyl-CoA carboxylase alpha subunit/acetyl-CoA carboxylase carboxyltransferase component
MTDEATPAFSRVAIINRGEPAMRLINAVRDLNLEHGTQMRTIALYTTADRGAMFVREADESFELGPAVFTDEHGDRKVGYLDYLRLERALLATRADAAWAGWGFVSEHPTFVDLCDRLGVTFIGPDAVTMRRLGDKITSKRLAEEADVPVVPWSEASVESPEDALAVATRLGYPVLIKATAGGGGRGIRRADSPTELTDAFAAARAEAGASFGDPTVFLESFVPAARHVEVQIVGDRAGTIWALGVRDCSVQRRNQKMIEETPSPILSEQEQTALLDAAGRIGRSVGYRSTGTVEFLFDATSRAFWFMEFNARLQVEHPITELTSGVDLVKTQLEVAAGRRLEPELPRSAGHAIEVRLNAEDPAAGFAPSPGVIDLLRFPTGPGLRVDTGVEQGDVVNPEFDSMIAKIVAHGNDRAEALARLRRALEQTEVVIENGTTNKPFLARILASADFAAGEIDVGWVDRSTADPTRMTSADPDVAIIAAAIDAYSEETEIESGRFRASAARGRPKVDDDIGRSIQLYHLGHTYDLDVLNVAPERFRIIVDGREISARIDDIGRSRQRLTIADTTYRVLTVVQGTSHLVEVNGSPHRIAHDEGGVIRAPSPSVVVSIDVAPGARVNPGDRLAVIEAMKMETAISAAFSGRVREVLVRENVQVNTGAPLLIIDPAEVIEKVTTTERVDFTRLAALVLPRDAHASCRHHLSEIRHMLLGYDVDPEQIAHALETSGRVCPEAIEDAEIRSREDAILGLFVDLTSLFRRERFEPEAEDTVRHSTEEYLFDYLRDPGGRDHALPESFRDQLLAALGHYGIEELVPTAALDNALYRIVKSHDRVGTQTRTILGILDDRLTNPELSRDESFESLLERLTAVSDNRFPAIYDLAREVHYRIFDQRFLAEVKDQALAEADLHLQALAADPRGPHRSNLVAALVDCPQSLTTFLSRRFEPHMTEANEALLEVMTRRYYRIRDLENVRTRTKNGFSLATAEYDHEGKRIHIISAHALYERLAEAAATLSDLGGDVEPDHDVVMDIYLWQDPQQGTAEDVRAHVTRVLDAALGSVQARRIVVAVSSEGSGATSGGVLHFTFRPDGESSYHEETLYRDLHPMMGKRLELWRLAQFDIRRLPTLEDIYLFHGTGKDNPRDERLFALAEVRDVTPIRDRDGSVIRLPDLERMFRDVLGAIRRFQALRAPGKRLQWNRVLLHVWPVIEITREETTRLVSRLAPETEGLGLHKVVLRVRLRIPGTTEVRPATFEMANPTGSAVTIRIRRQSDLPIQPLSTYEQRVVRLRRRDLVDPFEIVALMTPKTRDRGAGFPPGRFVEYDLAGGELLPVERPPGENRANVIVGIISNDTAKHPEGMSRVIVLGDPSRGMGSLAEPECRRIIAALDLAQKLSVPLEWFSVSAGALIAMDSGTENMDWIGLVLRRLIEFTQAGGEVNIVVANINAGAQPYWNAEATMLMHTKGILVMTPDSAMVLTGKQALDYSGGVSAEDNQGIGGYERVMGPNGQGQYFARDLPDACRILFQHYAHTFIAPGEIFPRRAATSDPTTRDVEQSAHGGEFATVGDVFSEETNPGRKKPFDIRQVMAACVDRDHATLERWFGMKGAEIAVVWDAHVGGYPIALLGIESRPMPRRGFIPADGPDQWTSGTLFPLASKKVARAINAASGNRPLVVLANLSGFDGSPESMRSLQLEYGAEIGRAVVNFKGPIVFCVVSRYHGGAFVVFSAALNDNMEIAALEGAHASVIGGAPAAAVVFAREVQRRIDRDERIIQLGTRLAEAEGAEKTRLRARMDRLRGEVHSEKLGDVADEFDGIHSVERAVEVGSVHRIIRPSQLRPYLVDAVERGIRRETERRTGNGEG